MPAPTTKEALRTLVQNEYAKLVEEVELVPTALAREPELEGGVSVADLIAYQIGWGRLLLGWYEAGKQGRAPILPAEGFKWNKLGDLARHFYMVYEDVSITDLLTEFKEVVDGILAMIEENQEAALFTPGLYPWMGRWHLAKFVAVNASSPYKSARAKMRKWRKGHTA